MVRYLTMEKRKNKTVYVVHCIDTEGPLSESLSDTFSRIKQIFGVDIKATAQNLHKLQQGKIDLGRNIKAIKKMLDPKLMNYKKTWADIGRMLATITDPGFRLKFPDSRGNGWIYNWFCMDHVGYTYNPRKRALGDHKIFDYYTDLLKKNDNHFDKIFFHYHPLPYNKKAHSCATFYLNQNHIFEILAKKVIDRQWFPAVFRPGFHAIRPDSNWFLEQWIPFDYSNQATARHIDQPDISGGRFGDWRRSPRIWGAYHPGHDDYQSVGDCRRWIFRCLNMDARLRKLTLQDVEEAFAQADKTGRAVISFTNHDYRDMASEIEHIYKMVRKVSEKWLGVKFRHCDALEAARMYLDLPTPKPLGLTASLFKTSNDRSDLEVSSDEHIFGPQPFLAIKDTKGNYYYDNFDFTPDRTKWRYVFDWQTFTPEQVDKIGIAAVGAQGQTEIVLCDLQGGKIVKELLNY